MKRIGQVILELVMLPIILIGLATMLFWDWITEVWDTHK